MNDANGHLRSFVERIERIEEQVRDFNSDKSDIYKEAKSNGFDLPALKAVIARRRKGEDKASELDAIVETYLSALASGTVSATRARTEAA